MKGQIDDFNASPQNYFVVSKDTASIVKVQVKKEAGKIVHIVS